MNRTLASPGVGYAAAADPRLGLSRPAAAPLPPTMPTPLSTTSKSSAMSPSGKLLPLPSQQKQRQPPPSSSAQTPSRVAMPATSPSIRQTGDARYATSLIPRKQSKEIFNNGNDIQFISFTSGNTGGTGRNSNGSGYSIARQQPGPKQQQQQQQQTSRPIVNDNNNGQRQPSPNSATPSSPSNSTSYITSSTTANPSGRSTVLKIKSRPKKSELALLQQQQQQQLQQPQDLVKTTAEAPINTSAQLKPAPEQQQQQQVTKFDQKKASELPAQQLPPAARSPATSTPLASNTSSAAHAVLEEAARAKAALGTKSQSPVKKSTKLIIKQRPSQRVILISSSPEPSPEPASSTTPSNTQKNNIGQNMQTHKSNHQSPRAISEANDEIDSAQESGARTTTTKTSTPVNKTNGHNNNNNNNNTVTTTMTVASQTISGNSGKVTTPGSKLDEIIQLKLTPQPANLITSFTWELYLKHVPAEVAPKEAFMQATEPLTNNFQLNYKLEARDPRNSSSWCLASVIATEGPRIRLRFDGSDSMNDLFELINSENIRPIGSKPGEILLPPMAYKGNLSNYPKYVEKILTKADAHLAPAEWFLPPPKRPVANLFKEGMKLEAVDRKNPYLICPATIGEVNGPDIKVLFDGWKGSFDYVCKYYSRDLFPINWCRDTKHSIVPPNGWDGIINPNKSTAKLSKSPLPKEIPASPSKPRGRPKGSKNLAKTTQKYKIDLSKTKSPKGAKAGTDLNLNPSGVKLLQNSNIARSPSRKQKESQALCPSPTPEDESEQPEFDSDETEPVSSVERPVFEEEDLDNVSPERKYHCQRVVPYADWLKLKKKESKLEGILNNISGKDVTGAYVELNSSSQSASETGANTSVVECHEQNNKSLKRMKFDTITSSKSGVTNPNASKSPCDWDVSEVLQFISSDESLAKYSTIFENHEIDGKAFLLLTTDVMINHMGFKIGPVLKINDLIEKAKRMK